MPQTSSQLNSDALRLRNLGLIARYCGDAWRWGFPSESENTDGRILRIGMGLPETGHTEFVRLRFAYVTCAPNYRDTVDRCFDRCEYDPSKKP